MLPFRLRSGEGDSAGTGCLPLRVINVLVTV
jgi:hypothetical protein